MVEVLALTGLSIALIAALVIWSLVLNEHAQLRRFRKHIKPGDKVMVDNGQSIFMATVNGVGPGYARVKKDNGQIAAHGLKCIYPVNHFLKYASATDSDLRISGRKANERDIK